VGRREERGGGKEIYMYFMAVDDFHKCQLSF
jgi:hypothetical protein